MMRSRLASVIAALYLLASAATAYAECAWVMWGPPLQDKWPGAISAGPFTIFGAYESRDRCEQEFAKFSRPMQMSLVCLPDTVDPRGPKER
jgi:hypothetical protein